MPRNPDFEPSEPATSQILKVGRWLAPVAAAAAFAGGFAPEVAARDQSATSIEKVIPKPLKNLDRLKGPEVPLALQQEQAGASVHIIFFDLSHPEEGWMVAGSGTRVEYKNNSDRVLAARHDIQDRIINNSIQKDMRHVKKPASNYINANPNIRLAISYGTDVYQPIANVTAILASNKDDNIEYLVNPISFDPQSGPASLWDEVKPINYDSANSAGFKPGDRGYVYAGSQLDKFKPKGTSVTYIGQIKYAWLNNPNSRFDAWLAEGKTAEDKACLPGNSGAQFVTSKGVHSGPLTTAFNWSPKLKPVLGENPYSPYLSRLVENQTGINTHTPKAIELCLTPARHIVKGHNTVIDQLDSGLNDLIPPAAQ